MFPVCHFHFNMGHCGGLSTKPNTHQSRSYCLSVMSRSKTLLVFICAAVGDAAEKSARSLLHRCTSFAWTWNMNESINIVNFQPIGLKSVSLLTSRWLTQNVPFNFSRVITSNLSHPQRSKQRGANVTVFKCPSSYFRWLSTLAVFLSLKYNHEGCLTRLSPANDIWQWLDDLLRLFMIARPSLTFTGDAPPPPPKPPCRSLRICCPPAGLSICCFSTFQATIFILVLLKKKRISFIAFHTTVQSFSAVPFCHLIFLLL